MLFLWARRRVFLCVRRRKEPENRQERQRVPERSLRAKRESEESAENSISISIPTRRSRIITRGEDGGDNDSEGKEKGGVVKDGEEKKSS